MTLGEHLKAWRSRLGISQGQAAALAGLSRDRWKVIERGFNPSAKTRAAIEAVTGMKLPPGLVRPQPSRNPVRSPKMGVIHPLDEEDESDIRGRHCWHCCGLPHRRPQSKPCRCGESWAPDIVQHPVPGLRSSASWCGDYADAKEVEA